MILTALLILTVLLLLLVVIQLALLIDVREWNQRLGHELGLNTPHDREHLEHDRDEKGGYA